MAATPLVREELGDELTGVLVITSPVLITARVDGTVVVDRGGDADIPGLVEIDLIIEPGARCNLSGLVGGWVINRGGVLDVRGAISGDLVEVSGRTTIHRGAVIARRRW